MNVTIHAPPPGYLNALFVDFLRRTTYTVGTSDHFSAWKAGVATVVVWTSVPQLLASVSGSLLSKILSWWWNSDARWRSGFCNSYVSSWKDCLACSSIGCVKHSCALCICGFLTSTAELVNLMHCRDWVWFWASEQLELDIIRCGCCRT